MASADVRHRAMAKLTKADLRARLALGVRHAEEVLLRDGHVAPFAALTTGDGTLIPVALNFSSPDAKTASMNAARFLAIAEDAQIAIHMTEAWLVIGQTEPGVSPSQSERRVETVVVAVQGRIAGKLLTLSSVRAIERGMASLPVFGRSTCARDRRGRQA